MINMGVILSKHNEKLDLNRLEIIKGYEIETFFLHILLNNPRFSLFLLNQDYKKTTSDNSKFLLKEMAYKLIFESSEKNVVNSSNFINEFNKINNYIVYSPTYLTFIKKFFSSELLKKENNILQGVKDYNKNSSTQAEQLSTAELMFYFQIPKYDNFYHSCKYQRIPFLQINEKKEYYYHSIEYCIKLFFENYYGKNINYFYTIPEILIIFIDRSFNYNVKIYINTTLKLKQICPQILNEYDLVGLICKEECFYKNFFNNKWYNYDKNKNIIEINNIEDILKKNLIFVLLLYKEKNVNYSKEIQEIKNKRNISIKPSYSQEIQSYKPNNRYSSIKTKKIITCEINENNSDNPSTYKNILAKLNNNNNNENILKNEKYFGYGKVGLRNIGCTCFMNSVLQCVKNLYQITHYFLAEESSKKELTLIYKDLLLNLCQKNIQSISPKKIKTAIGKKDSDFLEYTPNNSKDFLMLLFDCLGNENPIKYEEGRFLPKMEDKEKFEKAIRKIQFSKISFICNFALKKTIKCHKCNRNSENFQFYNILDLPIITENGQPIKSLIDAIKNFEIEKYNKCKCNSYLKSKTIIYTLPEIFIIHLQRSNFTEHSQHYVSFPKELSFDNILSEFNTKYKKYNYELVGVINHHGTQYGGHNFSYCKNFFDDSWYEYNDEEVKPIKESYICTKYGFLLFYQLINLEEKNELIKDIVETVDKNPIKEISGSKYGYISSDLSQSVNFGYYYK